MTEIHANRIGGAFTAITARCELGDGPGQAHELGQATGVAAAPHCVYLLVMAPLKNFRLRNVAWMGRTNLAEPGSAWVPGSSKENASGPVRETGTQKLRGGLACVVPNHTIWALQLHLAKG